MEGALTLSWRDMGRTAGILCAASLVGLLFYKAGITEANIVTVYLLAVLCTALATDGRCTAFLRLLQACWFSIICLPCRALRLSSMM